MEKPMRVEVGQRWRLDECGCVGVIGVRGPNDAPHIHRLREDVTCPKQGRGYGHWGLNEQWPTVEFLGYAPGYGPTEAPACGCDTPGWQACRRTRDTVCICTCHANSAPQQASASADFGPMWVLKEQAEATIATRDAEIARLNRDLLNEKADHALCLKALLLARADQTSTVARLPAKPVPEPYRGIDEWDLLPDV